MIRTRAMAVALLVIVLMFGVSTTAGAHAGDQSYLYLDITNRVDARLEMPFLDVEEYLGISIGGTEDEVGEQIQSNAAALTDFAIEHVGLSSGGEVLALTPVGVERVLQTKYVAVLFSVAATPEDFDGEFEVTLDPFFDENRDRDALLVIGNDWNRGFVDNEAEALVRFTDSDRSQTVELGASSWWRNLTASVTLGLNHIETGPDHILFVTVLILPAVLTRSDDEWKPVPTYRRSLWRVLKVVSMFTVAHSITFTLAGLGVLPQPSAKIVESIIALSIVAAALHNLRPAFIEREWLIAFSFGLFHGLGFATLVGDLDVTRTTQLVSLLGRNIGIEIGQALVVLIVFPALFLLRRTTAYLPLFRLSSALLVFAGLGWMTERLFDWRAVTTRVVGEVLSLPRAFVLLGLVTLLAAAFHWFERSNSRLLAISSEADLDDRANSMVSEAKSR